MLLGLGAAGARARALVRPRVANSAAAAAAAACGDLGQPRWEQRRRLAKYSRNKVRDDKGTHVRAKEKILFRREVAQEGGEEKYEDFKERMKASPGRTSMGRGAKGGGGFGRKDFSKGLRDLDLLEVPVKDAPDRVQLHKKDMLLKGIPEAVLDGNQKTVRQMRAEAQVHTFLMELLHDRKIPKLDAAVTHVMGEPHCVMEITRVDVSHDIRNVMIWWTPPFTPGIISETVVERLDKVMRTFKGAFRTHIAALAEKRFAPYVEVRYDEAEVRKSILQARLRASMEQFERLQEDPATRNDELGAHLKHLEQNIDDFDVDSLDTSLKGLRIFATKGGFKAVTKGLSLQRKKDREAGLSPDR